MSEVKASGRTVAGKDDFSHVVCSLNWIGLFADILNIINDIRKKVKNTWKIRKIQKTGD